MARLPESLSAESLLARTVRGIRGADAKALEAARARQQLLTKPEGSLGLLEDLSIRLAGMYGQVPVTVPSHPVVGLFAGDHGVWAQGVSPDPQEITTQQMINMAAGGAAISVLSRQMGAQLWITDVGARHEVDAPIRQRCVRRGTDDISQGPAMSLDEAVEALEVGIETGVAAVEQGADILITGEMGIANTTPASALISVFTGLPPAEVTGSTRSESSPAPCRLIDPRPNIRLRPWRRWEVLSTPPWPVLFWLQRRHGSPCSLTVLSLVLPP